MSLINKMPRVGYSIKSFSTFGLVWFLQSQWKSGNSSGSCEHSAIIVPLIPTVAMQLCNQMSTSSLAPGDRGRWGDVTVRLCALLPQQYYEWQQTRARDVVPWPSQLTTLAPILVVLSNPWPPHCNIGNRQNWMKNVHLP